LPLITPLLPLADDDFDTPRFSPDDITSRIVSHYYYFHAFDITLPAATIFSLPYFQPMPP
jgi:hypothetical protein